MAARANQALGAPHLPPGTRAGGAGPEGLEGGRALPKACAPRETDGKKQEAESRPLRWWGHRPAGSGAAATPQFPGCTRAHWGRALDLNPATRHFLPFFTYLALLPVPRAPGEQILELRHRLLCGKGGDKLEELH